MKKLNLIGIAICISLSLVGCSGESQKADNETSISTISQVDNEGASSSQESEEPSSNQGNETTTEENTIDLDTEAQKIYSTLGSVAMNCILNGTMLEDGTYLNTDYADTEFFKAAQTEIDKCIENGYISENYAYIVTIKNKQLMEVSIIDENGEQLGTYHNPLQ